MIIILLKILLYQNKNIYNFSASEINRNSYLNLQFCYSFIRRSKSILNWHLLLAKNSYEGPVVQKHVLIDKIAMVYKKFEKLKKRVAYETARAIFS